MSIVTRRALMVSGVGLAAGAFFSRAEAATGALLKALVLTYHFIYPGF
jgi:hypothetical protein